MQFTILLCLVAVYELPFALAGEESDDDKKKGAMKMLKTIVCGEDETETGKEVLKCMAGIESEEYKNFALECSPEIGDMSEESMKNYICSMDEAKMEEGEDCMQEKVEQSGKKDEIEEAMMSAMMCVSDVLKNAAGSDEEEDDEE